MLGIKVTLGYKNFLLCSCEVFRGPLRLSSLLGGHSGGANVGEYLKSSGLVKHTYVERLKVVVVLQLVRSLFSKSHVLLQHCLECELLLVENIELRVKELASVAVGTVGRSMELIANLGLVVAWQVALFNKFLLAMSEGTLV